ncbi:RagB/SusD family nutrient uptake outer membrane protein [Sphingobacterium bovistauri]|uniref:RagB/SusD family nutrient uptake outer membrane protein n=1 Tax=Sphingobacterium bovistauri TaxID=2781959 RepID=A0ABS7Z1E7_9SPHI|nr:RagB/SusD family nutrient uptake outer membrane protein [Sphingobacterium bovistauri]MCA5003998.1 RagB/SusD family nutrient uptake outer membrane protein [Sphingobacterium bovistauri]
MKKIFSLSLVLLLLMCTSCGKFLEESSQDLIRPQNVEHYKELLRGEGYYKTIQREGWFFDVMTDNIHLMDLKYPSTTTNSVDQRARNPYQWAQNLEITTGTFKDGFYQFVYKNILAANSCLEGAEEATGTTQEISSLKGQAYFIRAYGYFLLANAYAQAYNESNDEDLSVPIKLTSTPTLEQFARATRKEVWSLIASDIEDAISELSTAKDAKNLYEVNYKAALLLASRIYLFMEDYEKAIKYGEKFIDLHPNLRNISNYTSVPNLLGASRGDKVFLYVPDNPEVVFAFGTTWDYASCGSHLFYSYQSVGASNLNYSVSKGVKGALYDMYDVKDKRRSTWFGAPFLTAGMYLARPYHTIMKISDLDGCKSTHNFRSGEVYLTLAEAYARKSNPDVAKSIQYLNVLRQNRINQYVNLAPSDFSNDQKLIEFIWDERRRELCFEEFHRWWDLRRIGQPRLEHEYFDDVYVLAEKDPAYILNFPKSEVEYSPKLVQNQRPVRNPE